jgi:DNA polymerase-3 subunit delta'
MLDLVIGQPDGVKYLREIISGSLKCPLLLEGPEGVGRRFSVQQAAREGFPRKERDRQVNLDQLDAGVHPDWHQLLDGGKEIGVDAVREVLDRLAQPPVLARFRFVLIDSCDRMTAPAANALLKTLEEPPQHVRFFLVCSHANRVLKTIRSRCGRVRYRKLPDQWVLEKLAEVEQDSLRARVCCRYAQGSVGEAMRFWASGRLSLRSKVIQALKGSLSGDWSGLCQSVDSAEKELPAFMTLLEHVLRDLQLLGSLPNQITNLDLFSDLQAINPPRATLTCWLDGYYQLPKDTTTSTFSLHLKTYLMAGGPDA